MDLTTRARLITSTERLFKISSRVLEIVTGHTNHASTACFLDFSAGKQQEGGEGSGTTGEIALAPNPSPVSRTPGQEDFVLTMRDVLSANMRAKLVVLSCCHSACGEIKAEGVVGIARAFLGAGARSVLVSLWAIDDQASMEFMKIFYQHLVKGESASTALNQAMKSMRESDEFSEVKYWAPFVLIGDDVTLELGEQE